MLGYLYNVRSYKWKRFIDGEINAEATHTIYRTNANDTKRNRLFRITENDTTQYLTTYLYYNSTIYNLVKINYFIITHLPIYVWQLQKHFSVACLTKAFWVQNV